MTFSERFGLRQPKLLVQVDDMDGELRTALWNAAWQTLYESIHEGPSEHLYRVVFKPLWTTLWKLPLDNMPGWGKFWDTLRKVYFEWDWNDVYDVVDRIASYAPELDYLGPFVVRTNEALERERSAYRIVGGRLQRLTTTEEIAAVETALEDVRAMPAARRHLDRAAELLADRAAPDYRNSIKESISAVESVCEQLSGTKGSLGGCLKRLEGTMALHPALSSAFQKLYGYTSDAEGIRHALSKEPTLDHADALYMLVACSAFVSYLLAKSAT